MERLFKLVAGARVRHAFGGGNLGCQKLPNLKFGLQFGDHVGHVEIIMTHRARWGDRRVLSSCNAAGKMQ